jgi:type I restriction enzyme S subunit
LDTDEWIHQNHVIRVRLEKSVCLPEFVSRFLNSDQGKMQMLEKARTTSGLYTLSAGKVSELEVPTPPIAEQEQLSADLAEQTRTIEHIQALIEDKYHELERIPSALLRQAFSGQL